MAKPLGTATIAAPGFLGLNTQESSIQLSSGFALTAQNCVIDRYGRIGARRGWASINESATFTVAAINESTGAITEITINDAGSNYVVDQVITLSKGTEHATVTVTEVDDTDEVYSLVSVSITEGGTGYSVGDRLIGTSNADLGASNIEFLFEMVDPVDGNKLISGGNNKLFVGTSTLVAKTVRNDTNSGDVSYTISNNDWQAASLPYGDGSAAVPHAYIVQTGHEALVYHELPVSGGDPHDHDSGVYGFQRLGDVGSLPPGYTTTDFKPNCTVAAYGRIWMADIIGDRQTVYFSQLLNGSEFNGGDSGSLSLNAVFPNNDQIVGLAAHNGFLIIFGRNNLAIYANPIDVTQLTLADFIPNVGCVARDSIVNTGTDIIFLSDSGVRSLQRVIQEKSLPMRDLSKNVRDELVANVASETTTKIRAVYYDRDAFYLLALPATRFVYCFDLRAPLQDGAARVTIWDSIEPHAFTVNTAKELLVGKNGYVGKYYGHTDNGDSYRFRYFTNYFDFDQPTNIKVLKKAGFVVIGGSAQPIAVKYGFEYTDNYQSITKVLDSAVVYEYGIGEYGIAEYSGGIILDRFTANLGGSGAVMQIGVESDIDGNPLSIQKIDVGVKLGKTVI